MTLAAKIGEDAPNDIDKYQIVTVGIGFNFKCLQKVGQSGQWGIHGLYKKLVCSRILLKCKKIDLFSKVLIGNNRHTW